MKDISFDELARMFGGLMTRRLMGGVLLGGAFARLGPGAVNANQGMHGRGGQTRTAAPTGRGKVAATAATSGRCTPGCGVCQHCKTGACRKTNSGRKRCQKGTCLASGTGTACVLGTGASGTCQNGACVHQCTGGLTDCSGVCKHLPSDPANCGQCGKTCAAPRVCMAGACCFPNGTPSVCTADNFTEVCCPGPTGQKGCEIPIRGGLGTCVAL